VIMELPKLLWDMGTAYDLFVSLEVLHRPAEFGVRGAWAAGMRARLPAEEREALEQGQFLVHAPLHWIHGLPEPKDGNTALWSLTQMPAAERLSALALSPEDPCEAGDLLRAVAARGAWDETDREALRAAYLCKSGEKGAHKRPSADELARTLDVWSRPEEFGESYLQALSAYQEVFFAEEERRIRPALQEALGRAQELAEQLPLMDLLEELSQGLRFVAPPDAAELVLAPSFWCTPLMFMGEAAGVERQIFLFGARPADASLVPGEMIPEALLRALTALSDPTRLRILYYLAEEPLGPTDLSRRLRLRVPTVIHHLKTLRLAGLVQLTVSAGRETGYAARFEAVEATCDALKGFLKSEEANSR
jgi:DNA-binding transcriptional ArsR family regulator